MQRDQAEVIARIRESHPGHSVAERLTRDELYDRDALR
jgi:hypothetical protein